MKILTCFLKYDYGQMKRGFSLEYTAFYPAIEKNCSQIYPFWLEDNGFPNNLEKLQNNLINTANSINPDIIFFILMKNEIYATTLQSLSKRFITVNWFCDDHWRFENFTKYIAPLFSYSITVDKYSISKYNEIRYKNVIKSQWAYNSTNLKLEIKSNYLYDVSFIGSKNNVRQWYIDYLQKNSIKVNCFGAGWENGRISYEDAENIIRQSKINLNLSNSMPLDYRYKLFTLINFIKQFFLFRGKSIKQYVYNILKGLSSLLNRSKKNVEQVKARNFEICGCGGFQLSQYALELEDYFIIGKEIAIFTNPDELLKQIKYYLENESQREEIKIKGIERAKSYSYENRIKTILERINSDKSINNSI